MSKIPKLSPTSDTDVAAVRTLKNVGRCTVAFILLSVAAYTMTHGSQIKVVIGTFLYWTQGLGGWGLLALIVAYVIFIVLMIPTTLLNVGAGYSAGVLLGFPCMLLGGVIGAGVAFFLGRTLARECVSTTFYRYNTYLRRIDQGLLQGRDAFRFVFLSRVPPCMPFPVLNYLYGTTGIDFYTYISATACGLSPGTFMYVYAGHAIRSLVDLMSGDPKSIGIQYQILFVMGMVVSVLVSMYLANQARLVGQMPLPSESHLSVLSPCLGPQTVMDVPGSHGECKPHDEEMGLLEIEQPLKPLANQDREGDGFVVWLSAFDVRSFGSSITSALQ